MTDRQRIAHFLSEHPSGLCIIRTTATIGHEMWCGPIPMIINPDSEWCPYRLALGRVEDLTPSTDRGTLTP